MKHSQCQHARLHVSPPPAIALHLARECPRLLATLLLIPLLIALFARSAPGQSHSPGAPQFPKRTITDETGRTIALPRRVQRIVSLAPSVTETLFALGLGDRVVGDTTYCDYPAEAKSKAHVGGPIDPSVEQIAALHPDLVIATRSINRQNTVNSLQQLGIAVYATDPRTVEQVLDSSERLDRLIRANDPAPNTTAADDATQNGPGASMVADLRRRLANVRAKLLGVPAKRVFFVVWQVPLVTVGRDTFLADALHWAGARTALELPQDWPNVSLEAVVRAQPEYLIFSSDDRSSFLHHLDELRNQPGWRDLHAMRDLRTIILPESISHPSPRLVDAIEELARALYPDRFAFYHASPSNVLPPASAVNPRPLSFALPSAFPLAPSSLLPAGVSAAVRSPLARGFSATIFAPRPRLPLARAASLGSP